MMNTLAGVIVPAAVIIIGKIFREWFARQQHRHVAGQVRLRGEHVHLLRPGDARDHFQADRAHAPAGQLAAPDPAR